MLKPFVLTGAIAALAAVIFGAFGAHALKSMLSASQLTSWHTAVDYQFYHGLALLILPALRYAVSSRLLSTAGICFVAGIVLFSGSIYLLTLLEWRFLGPVTPLGGLFFMIGWVALITGVVKGKWHE